MAGGGSRFAVVAAIGGNFFISIAKFVGFAFTGSAALLSEAVHSVADTLNQVLLLIGVVRSGKQADTKFHYGYRREAHIWALISAVGIFFLGCGVTVYHGVSSLLSHDPHAHGDMTWAIGVLILAALVEGAVLMIAVREVKRSAGDRPFFRYLKQQSDPAVLAVLMEDSVAVVGVFIALVSIGLAEVTGSHLFDAIGSILIGLLLGFVAVWLIWRNHRLLVGPSAPQEVRVKVREIMDQADSVEKVVVLRSRMIDSSTLDFELQVEFNGSEIAKRLDSKLEEAWKKIQDLDSFKKWAAGFSHDVVTAIGAEIDDLEAKIREQVPEAKFVDIEPS